MTGGKEGHTHCRNTTTPKLWGVVSWEDVLTGVEDEDQDLTEEMSCGRSGLSPRTVGYGPLVPMSGGISEVERVRVE